MSKRNYTILERNTQAEGSVYRVFVDNTKGFDEFTGNAGNDILPGSTVDIADVKAEFRLRHDGTWEQLRSYAASEEEAAALDEAAAAELLDTLIPDEEVETETESETETENETETETGETEA